MRRKILFSVLFFYVLLIGFIYLYLFVFNTSELPRELVGTVSDPSTFLTKSELIQSEDYSNIRNFLFFIEIPFEWIFYLVIMLFGIAKVFNNWAGETTKVKLLRSAIFTFCLSFVTYIAFFPIRFIRYYLSKNYGISTQSFTSWMKDGLIDFWLDWLLLFLVVSTIYWLMRKNEKKWWLYAWFLSIPFALFMMFIQPVVIDPLYNDFYPLQNQQLEEKILDMAKAANIPADHVYEVNMSEKTNSLNAYVTGIGSNARIVLWDTTLKDLNDEEIVFITAHEMAHYVEKHIYIGIAGYLLLLLAILFLTDKILKWTVRKHGDLLNISGIKSLASLPLLLLIVSVLSFAASPFENAFSRYQEMRADRYAIEMTGDVDAGVSTFQELTRSGLSQVNPPALVKWLRYGHPTMLERIIFIQSYENGQTDSE